MTFQVVLPLSFSVISRGKRRGEEEEKAEIISNTVPDTFCPYLQARINNSKKKMLMKIKILILRALSKIIPV